MANDVEITIGAQDQASSILDAIGESTANLASKLGSLAYAIPGVGQAFAAFDMFSGILDMIPGAQEQFQELWDWLSGSMAGAATTVTDAFFTVFQSTFAVNINDFGSSLVSSFSPIIETVSEGVSNFATSIAQSEPILTSLRTVVMSLNAMLEAFGQMIYAIVTPAIEFVTQAFANLFGQADAGLTGLESLATSVAATFRWWAESVIGAITLVEVIFSNLTLTADVVINSVLLSIEQMSQGFQYTFTQVIPTYIKWFADNFYAIFYDMGQRIVTIASNLWENITNIFQGKGWTKSLLEGFEATTTAIPEIADRVQSDAERYYANAIEKSTAKMATSYSQKYNERIKSLKDNIERDTTQNIPTPKVPQPDLNIPKAAVAAVGKDGKEDDKKKKETEAGILKATESRLLTRGEGVDASLQVQEDTKINTQKVAEYTQQSAQVISQFVPSLAAMTTYLEMLTRKDPVQVEGVG